MGQGRPRFCNLKKKTTTSLGGATATGFQRKKCFHALARHALANHRLVAMKRAEDQWENNVSAWSLKMIQISGV